MTIPDDPASPGPGWRRSPPWDREDIALPASAAGDSIEALTAERHARAPVVYLLILGLVVIGCAALPLVHVPVAVRATGMIRPSVEKHDVRAAASGVVADARMQEGMLVAAGEPLLRISVPAESTRGFHLLERRRELASAIADLERIPSAADSGEDGTWEPDSPDLRAALRSERSAAAERRGRIDRIRAELSRAERLMALELLAATEVEGLRFDLREAEAGLARIEAESHAGWTRQLAEHRARLTDVDGELALLRATARFYRLTAPVAGSLESVVPVAAGSFVTAGERLATVSPRARMRVEAYVPARNVALVRPGDPARVRIDGYDPGEWGLLPGRVLSVADDHALAGDQAVFRILIQLDRDHLLRPDGRVGPLRKGMMVEARIVVARPSVYSLLRGSLTEWTRPRAPHR